MIASWSGTVNARTGVASGNRHLRGSSDGFVIRSRRFGTSRGDRDRPPQVVSKSYPHYWEDLKAAGFSIRESAL